MNRSWKTTLGGSFQAMGTVLMGVGLVPGLTDMEAAEQLKWLVISGLACQALGAFFANLFAADSAVVVKMIEKSGGDTAWAKLETPKPL
jgi:hypothetical protein